MITTYLRNNRGFFSDYYLGSVLARGRRGGFGPTDRETDTASRRFTWLRERAEGRCAEVAQCRERFLRPLLRDILGFHLGAGEDRIHGLWTSAEDEAAGKPPVLLVYCGAWDEDLDAGRRGAIGAATRGRGTVPAGSGSPLSRLEKAMAAKDLRHGLLATGERLRLVRAVGDGPKGACLEADLAGLEDEATAFPLFHRLFHISCFTPGPAGRPPIGEIEEESRRHAEKVSEELKGSVFSAAEELVAALLKGLPEADKDLRLCRDAALSAFLSRSWTSRASARCMKASSNTSRASPRRFSSMSASKETSTRSRPRRS